ncbi:MAG: hypothetical protein PHS02_00210 [Candidatus ainarchaeum sp.]|nr:hypothetical protein [Candidatus ainarchaeum sp.]
MAEIEQYAADSQKELSQLREFAEIKYMKGYLKELESVSESYNEEYEQVKAQDQSLGDRIAEAKKNIENMVRESRELVKSMEEKTSGKEFEALLSEVKAREEAVVATVQEKSSEREKFGAQFQAVESRKPAEKAGHAKKAPQKAAGRKKEKGKIKKK